MSTEQRDIRPFEPLPRLDSIVKGCVLHLGAHSAVAGSNLAVTATDYEERRLRVALPWESETEGGMKVKEAIAEVESAGYTPAQVGLAVISQSRFLKLRDLIAVMPLADLGTVSSIDVEVRPPSLRTPRSGSEISVSFVLLQGTEPRLLQAWRKGTWLHQSTFRLSTDLSQVGFTPRPLTDEEREAKQLPSGTLRYIVLNESPLDDGVSEDMVEMWVDSDLLHGLSTQPNSPVSRVMQAQLFVDCVWEIASTALGDPNFSGCGWEDVKDTLFGRVVIAVVPRPASHEIDEASSHYGGFLDLVRSDPSRFMAYAEDLAELRKRHKEAMEA